MRNNQKWTKEFSKEAYDLTQPEVGLRLIATIDKRGWPHLTMISSNRAKTPKQIVWGQFTEGTSKKNILANSKQGIFFMNAAMPYKFVQAKANFDYSLKGGEDCERFSRGQLLRYMTYVNIHTSYYNEVVAVTEVRNLGLLGIVKGFLVDLLAVGGARNKKAEKKIPEFGYSMFNQMTSVKVLSYIQEDGYPIIIPCFGLRAPDQNKLIFPLSQYKEELLSIPENTRIAIFVVVSQDLELTNMQINGTFMGFKRIRGFKYGFIEIDEIYNSMPPLNGVIYPNLELRPKVTTFPSLKELDSA